MARYRKVSDTEWRKTGGSGISRAEFNALLEKVNSIEDKVTLSESELILTIAESVNNKSYSFEKDANQYKKLLIVTSRGQSVQIDVDTIKMIGNGTVPVASFFSDTTGNYMEGYNGSIGVASGKITTFNVINTYLKGWSSKNIRVFAYK